MRAAFIRDIEQPEPRRVASDQNGNSGRNPKCDRCGKNERQDHEAMRWATRSGAAVAKLFAVLKPNSRSILAAL